ncbi:MAG TPA: hypothetical protein VFE86_12030, partial [Ilumatobacteraceae bacterium]|nr:hypothetical protein [Ilumatobacteraceae bacterium]
MRKKLLYSLIGILVVAFGGLILTVASGDSPSLGLDLQGGISITQKPVGDFNTSSLDLAVDRIRERVDSLGVAEPEILRQGDAVVVNLPGVKNQAQAEELVKVTGQVYLRPVLTDDQFNLPCVTSDPSKKPDTTTTTTTIAGATTTAVAGAAATGAATTGSPTTVAPTTTAADGPSRRTSTDNTTTTTPSAPTSTSPASATVPSDASTTTTAGGETTTTVAG